MTAFIKKGKRPGIDSLLVRGLQDFQQPGWEQIRVPLVMNTPYKRQIGSVDIYPNLLVTTLAVVAVSLPPGKPHSESAPSVKRVLAIDHVRPLTLGINPNPNPVQWSDSAPPPKAPVYVFLQPNYLPLGINPNPQARQVSESAPPRKYQVQLETFPNYLPLGINPNPGAVQHSTSAPQVKLAVQVDSYPNLSVTTLLPLTTPIGVQVSDSAPPRKYQVQVDTYPNYLPLGINPNPRATSWNDSAPPPKFAVQVDTYPNQQTTLFFVPPTFPPGVQYSESATSNYARYTPQIDVPANLTSVIPATVIPPDVPRVPEPPAGKKRYRDIYRITVDGHKFEFKTLFDALQFLEKTKAEAEKLAQIVARNATEKQKQTRTKVQIPSLPMPKIEISSRDLRGAVSATKKEISQIYETAVRDCEIAILVELKKREQDNEDIIWLL